jgi:hypothetical protein
MKNPKALLSFALVVMVFVTQVGTVFAAPTADQSVSGTVTALACQTDQVIGDKTFLVTVQPPHGPSQIVRVDQATAESLGLVELDGDGNPDCRPEALAKAVGTEVTIASTDILPDTEEAQHPVGAALATFFEEITNYDAIMQAHENGYGFGLIAQALWLTQKLGGNTETFLAILQARKTGDYSSFTFADGTPVPENWGQFRKLILDGDKQHGSGVAMSDKNKEHSNNGGGGNGNGDSNGSGQGNGNPDDTKNNDHGNKGKHEDRGNGKHR